MATEFIPKIVYTGPTTLLFDLPPKNDYEGESFNSMGTTRVSKSGDQQRINDYIEVKNKITYSHLDEAKVLEVDTFLQTHALLGKSFSYFFDNGDAATEVTGVTLDRNGFKPKFKIIRRALNNNLYEVTLNFRRLL